jgi:hypothetical protein
MASPRILAAATFVALPWEMLPASAAVDFLQLAACEKTGIRLVAPDAAHIGLVAWARNIGWATCSDEQGYVCAAKTTALAEHILALDRSADAHTEQLGIMLGYPACCSNKAAAAGEAQIDLLAEESSAWVFEGAFRLTRISGYLQGQALISHVPCSPRCPVSLALASKGAAWLREAPPFPWLDGPRMFLEEFDIGA